MKFKEIFQPKTTLMIFMNLLGAAEMKGQNVNIEEMFQKAKTIEIKLGEQAKKEGTKIINNAGLSIYESNIGGKKIRVVYGDGEGKDPTAFYGMEKGKNGDAIVISDINGDGQADYLLKGNLGEGKEDDLIKEAVLYFNSTAEENETVWGMKDGMGMESQGNNTMTLFCFKGEPYVLKPDGTMIKVGTAGSEEAKNAQKLGQNKLNKFLEEDYIAAVK